MPSALGSAARVLAPPPDAGTKKPKHIDLDPKTRRAMKLGARPAPAAAIAFGKGRIGVLEKDALLVRDTSKFAEVVKLPLEGAKAVTSLADGSLLAVGATRSIRLLPQDEKPQQLAHVPVFPLSIFFGDRVNPDRFWVLPWASTKLFGYDAVSSATPMLLPTDVVEVDGFNHDAFGSLRDGSFLYTAQQSFVQFYGTGVKHSVLGSTDGVVRILPGSRPDTAWIVRSDGTVNLFRLLEGKLYRLESTKLEATPYDGAAEGERLGFLELVEPDDRPWNFVLEVFDLHAKRLFRTELPGTETYGEDWVSKLTRDRDITMTSDPPLVAVGGATELHVYDSKSGNEVWKTP